MATETSGKKVGRPSKKDDESLDAVKKLLAAFWRGANVTEACVYAGISRETYYHWCREIPEFSDTIATARTKVNENAKAVIVDAIDGGDISAAKWWLERRNKKEFGLNAVDDPDMPTETEILEAKLQQNINKGIADKYRVYLFRKREAHLAEYSKKDEYLISRIDKLMQLPDKELADYAGVEIWATGSDNAEVRRQLIIRFGGENYEDLIPLTEEVEERYNLMKASETVLDDKKYTTQ